jgi:hypothetical protein
MPLISVIKEKKYRFEACIRSERFRNEFFNLWRRFLTDQRNKWANAALFSVEDFFKIFLKTPELKELARRFNIDSHSPFINLIKNNNSIDLKELKRIDSGVKVIWQESDILPVKLAIKDNNMIVNIDVRKSRHQILLEIDFLLKKYGRSRNTKKPAYDLNDFTIFDLSQRLSLWEITKRLYPQIRDKSPRYYAKNFDSKAKQLLKNVSDAKGRVRAAITAIEVNVEVD